MPSVPSDEPDDLAPVERLVQHGHRDQRRPDRHRVRDDRAAPRGQLLHAEQHEAVPAGDVEEREHRDASPPCRAARGCGRRDSFATSSMPSAANGSVIARKVSGASSVTPSFSTGQLHPHTSVRIAMGTNACASGCRDGHQRSRVGSVSPNLDWCSARACATHAVAADAARETRAASRRTRRCRARSSARSAGTCATPSWCSMRSSTGPTPTMSLRSSGAFGPSSSGGSALFSRSTTSAR